MEAFYLFGQGYVYDEGGIDGMYVNAPGLLPKRKGSDLGRIIVEGARFLSCLGNNVRCTRTARFWEIVRRLMMRFEIEDADLGLHAAFFHETCGSEDGRASKKRFKQSFKRVTGGSELGKSTRALVLRYQKRIHARFRLQSTKPERTSLNLT